LSYTRSEPGNAIRLAAQSTARGLVDLIRHAPYHANRMTSLIAIAASSTARLWWWRDATLAARWRD
jgi:hypothetical protein